jgi:folate-binding protein YgfZ
MHLDIIEVMASMLQPAVSSTISGEFQALVSRAGVCQLSGRAYIQASGNDRVRWLNGMISNNVRDLAQGSGVYAFVLNPQGRILGDLYAFNLGESLLLTTDQDQLEKLLGLLRRYIIMDKVELTDVSERWLTIAVAGPKAKEVLQRAGVEVPALERLQFTKIVVDGVEAKLTSGDNAAIEIFEIRTDKELTATEGSAKSAKESATAIVGALVKAGATAMSEPAWELLRIASGIPRYGVDIRERDLPQETEQLRALNFNKGCYIGQEIVERIRSRGNVHRTFTGCEFQGDALPEAGAKIRANGKEVGQITSVAVLPFSGGERRVGLGYFRREVSEPGTAVIAGESAAVVTRLPFVKT